MAFHVMDTWYVNTDSALAQSHTDTHTHTRTQKKHARKIPVNLKWKIRNISNTNKCTAVIVIRNNFSFEWEMRDASDFVVSLLDRRCYFHFDSLFYVMFVDVVVVVVFICRIRNCLHNFACVWAHIGRKNETRRWEYRLNCDRDDERKKRKIWA